jgi:hypothetical protein
MRQRRALARGTDRNKPVGALGNLPIDKIAEDFLIDRTVLERGDERREGASKACLGDHDTIRETDPGRGAGRRPSACGGQPAMAHKYRVRASG